MAFPESLSTWPGKRDALRRRLAAQKPTLTHKGRLCPAPGEVVAPGGVQHAVAARQAFLRIAAEVAPKMLTELAGGPLDEFVAHWDALGGPSDADAAPGRLLGGEILAEFVLMVLEEETETGSWVGTWGFPSGADWQGFLESVDGEDGAEALRRASVSGWGLTMAIWTLHTWRTRPLPMSDPPRLVDAFAGRAELEDGDLGLDEPLALPVPRWNPQREERRVAADRIQGEVHTAIRVELDRIEEAARRVGAPRPKQTQLEHLAWLARYQCGRESYATIADAVGRQRQSVTPAVQAAAELIRLPLRRSSPPGRPRKIVAPPPIRPRRPEPRPTAIPVGVGPEPGPAPVHRGSAALPLVDDGFDRAEPVET